MKLMLKNCSTHRLGLWMIVQKNVGLNFVSKNLVDSAAGDTFMGITFGEAAKLLDNMTKLFSMAHGARCKW